MSAQVTLKSIAVNPISVHEKDYGDMVSNILQDDCLDIDFEQVERLVESFTRVRRTDDWVWYIGETQSARGYDSGRTRVHTYDVKEKAKDALPNLSTKCAQAVFLEEPETERVM